MNDLYIFPDIEQLNSALAQQIVTTLETSLENGQPFFNLALSGGRTPQGLLARLVDKSGGSKLWGNVHIYWVDERHVPFDSPESNYGNARPFIESLGIPLDQIHPMGRDPDTEAAALSYHKLVKRIEIQRPAQPLFDLALLGIGPDGHMASLFPGTEHRQDVAYCKAAIQPASGQARISLTLPALNNSKQCIFLAGGSEKAEIISRVYRASPDPLLPATLIDPLHKPMWYIDQAAACLLGENK